MNLKKFMKSDLMYVIGMTTLFSIISFIVVSVFINMIADAVVGMIIGGIIILDVIVNMRKELKDEIQNLREVKE